VTVSSATDSTPGNNTATDDTTIQLRADLKVTKTDSPDPVYYLNNVTYTIKVENLGPSDATGVSLTDAIPAGTSYVSNTGGGTLSSGSVTWNLATISAGASTSVTLTVKVEASATSPISNTASASSSVSDPEGSNNSATATTSVSKRLVQLLYNGASSGQYSDPVGASATLMDVTDGPGTPIAGQTITFSLGGQTFTAVTSPTGLASTSTAIADRLNQPAGSKTIATSFAGSAVYQSKTDSDAYVVNKENATISMIDPSILQTDGNDSDVDSLKLTLTIDEDADGYLSGALPNAPSGQTGLKNAYPILVTLTRISNNNQFGSCTPALTSYTTVDDDTSTAYCYISNVPMDTYQVDAVIGGDYFVGDGVGALVVFDPSLGFITGGGWYTTDQGRVNFGFNAKYLKSGQVQGSLLVILHRPEGNYILKSNSMGSLTVAKDSTNTFWTAVLKGKATYQVPVGQPALWCGDRKCGGYNWTMYVEDRKEPGSGYDRFWLELKDPSGNIVTRLSLPTTPTIAGNAVTITGGNIQVPQPQSSTK
jgi:uncharacterized repeat protein (TIGR01451 family)